MIKALTCELLQAPLRGSYNQASGFAGGIWLLIIIIHSTAIGAAYFDWYQVAPTCHLTGPRNPRGCLRNNTR